VRFFDEIDEIRRRISNSQSLFNYYLEQMNFQGFIIMYANGIILKNKVL